LPDSSPGVSIQHPKHNPCPPRWCFGQLMVQALQVSIRTSMFPAFEWSESINGQALTPLPPQSPYHP
jgi:hypothetical protein